MITVDTHNFNGMIRELSRLSGADLRDVIRAEATAVLNQTIKNVAAEQVSLIDARVAAKKLSPSKGAELKARRGLSKLSFLTLGKQLGLSVKAPAYVSKAKVNGKEYPQKVKAEEKKQSGTEVIYLTNNMTTALAAGGKKAILKAINGRVGYFKNNLRKGVFEKAETIAKKYKGIKIVGI